MIDRPIPIHYDMARLIYRTWQDKMCEVGEGHMVYDWDHMSGDVRRVWEDSVSMHINWMNENIVKMIADRLTVPVNVRCTRPHA